MTDEIEEVLKSLITYASTRPLDRKLQEIARKAESALEVRKLEKAFRG